MNDLTDSYELSREEFAELHKRVHCLLSLLQHPFEDDNLATVGTEMRVVDC